MPKETFFTAISRWRVVSRRALAQERGVVGETPNLAARLQSLSAPNTLVIAEATRRQIGGLFDLEDLGPQQLAGFGEPQHAWQVLNESDEVSRFEALRSGETPLVGREEELELLSESVGCKHRATADGRTQSRTFGRGRLRQESRQDHLTRLPRRARGLQNYPAPLSKGRWETQTFCVQHGEHPDLPG